MDVMFLQHLWNIIAVSRRENCTKNSNKNNRNDVAYHFEPKKLINISLDKICFCALENSPSQDNSTGLQFKATQKGFNCQHYNFLMRKTPNNFLKQNSFNGWMDVMIFLRTQILQKKYHTIFCVSSLKQNCPD